MTAKTVSKTDSKYNVKLIAITAMCAALITVTTAFIKIPSPLGYSHAGDSMIYLAASILPGPFGIIASSIGGALADLISGYPHWAIPTAIIKAVNAVPFVLCRMAMTLPFQMNVAFGGHSLGRVVSARAANVVSTFVSSRLAETLSA